VNTRNVTATFLTAVLWVACGGDASGPVRTEVTADLLGRGSDLYKINCVACHGLEGKGDGPSAGMLDPPPRDHSDGAYMDQLSDTELAAAIFEGGAERGYPNMPSNPHIKGDDLAAIVAFVRTLSKDAGLVTEVLIDAESIGPQEAG
jgi:mono/diheme cytochrome c family protein